jgi:hypothetical protein
MISFSRRWNESEEKISREIALGGFEGTDAGSTSKEDEDDLYRF